MKTKSVHWIGLAKCVSLNLVLVIALSVFGCEWAHAQGDGKGVWQIDFQRKSQMTNLYLETPKITEEKGVLFLGAQSYEYRLPNSTEAYSTQTKALVTLDHAEKVYAKMPMHALVWFYNSEIAHRNALCNAFEAAQLSAAEMEPCSRFELESLFSFTHPQVNQLFDGKSVKINHRKVEEKHLFDNEGKLAVSFEPSAHSLGRDHSRMFLRFLAHICQIHPDIRQKIVDLGVLPAEFSHRTRDGTTEMTVDYRFSNIQFLEAARSFEIPKDYSPRSTDKRLEAIFAKLETTSVPSQNELLVEAEKQIDGFLAMHRTEEAVLAAYRFYLVTDNEKGLRDLLKRCGGMADRNVRQVVYDLANMRQIKKLKLSLESKDSPIAYLLNYYIADLAMAQHRNEEPIQEDLMKCLEKDELIIGAYIDLCRHYLQEWDPYTAWRCIEAARGISPRHSDLISVDQMERMIERDSPDFF